MYTAKGLLDVAIKEIGYIEKESNSQLDDKTANAGDGNWTKYARDLHKAGYYQAPKNGYAWCDMFVDWVCLQYAGSKEKGEWLQCQTGLYGAGCEWSSDCFRRAGRFGTEPKVGAQIFFGKKGAESHTGIVEKFDDTYVYTIEGNTSNRVARRTYKRTDSYIVGYGYMRFDEEVEVEDKKDEVVKKTVDELAKEVIAGKWGNGQERKDRLTAAGYSYREVQDRVNAMLKKPAQKTVDELAREVIQGRWGNGADRKKRLTDAGYDYRTIQNRVNEILS